ncbi:MAG: 16S rRNA (uracil(1498)-N(3))-methyltransferase [Eubacteriales bacterium]|nr:16S rRNA (uracil(1498)-N(3))-methyltransferase [Eubacteriales bacterium]
MQRFFVNSYQIDEQNRIIEMTGSDVNHMKNVLRMKIGEEVWISDGKSEEYRCSIASYGEAEATLVIEEKCETEYELPAKLYLFQGLPKGDKMELIIQKAVELGAYEIVPVEMKRCVVKLDEKKAGKKVQRWQQIAESAAKQSKRLIIPQIHEVMSYKEAIKYAKELDIVMLPYELAKGMSETRELIQTIKAGMSAGIFIGPEGGFDEAEIELAVQNDFQPITLGKRILRTETAGMTILSVLMFYLERND